MHATVVRADGVVMGPLIDALARVDISEAFVLANAIGDSHIFDPVPDFVVGVLNPLARQVRGRGLTNLDVVLRIGRAVERGLPTLLIVPPPLPTLAPTANVAVAYCPLDNEVALHTHLSAFVATATDRRQPSREQGTVSNPHSAEIVSYLSDAPDLSVAEFEALVARLIEGSETKARVSKQSADLGFDLVAVPEDAPNNVVLIQAKMGRAPDQQLALWEDQLQNYVVMNRASLGLLVYYDRDDVDHEARASTPLVVSISLKNLAERLEGQSFAQMLNNVAAESGGSLR